jgi:hypothetical protein
MGRIARQRNRNTDERPSFERRSRTMTTADIRSIRRVESPLEVTRRHAIPFHYHTRKAG